MYKTRVQLDAVKGDPIRRAELLRETAQTIALVSDMMERQEYIRQCAYLLSVNEEALTSEVAKAINANRIKGYEQSHEASEVQKPAEAPSGDSAEAGTAGVDGGAGIAGIAGTTGAAGISGIAGVRVDERERHLIALLLNYGNHLIPQNGQEYPLAQYVVSDIMADDLSFSDSRCQAIYEYFRDEVCAGREVDSSVFITYEDAAVREFAISLMVDTWRVSDSWWEKKKISVPTIEDNLELDMRETLMAFKTKCIDARIEENAKRFRELKNSDENAMFALLSEKKHLIDLRRQLGCALHYVIT